MYNTKRGTVKTILVLALFFIALMAKAPHGSAFDWSSDTQLTTNQEHDITPSIMQTRNGTIWVVWSAWNPMSYQFDLYYKTSSDNGISWSDSTSLITSLGQDQWPAVMESQNETIWVVWDSDIMGNREIFYTTSSNGGLSWSPMVQLTNNSVLDAAPAITQNVNGTIGIVWQRNESEGDRNIFGVFSSDNGLTWSNETRLTTDPSWDMQPSITETQNGTLWLAWTSYRPGDNYDLYYKTSSDNGLSWSDAFPLTTDSRSDDMRPGIVQDMAGTMVVVWEKDSEIYYKNSSNYGASWSPDTLLTKSSGDDINPSITKTKNKRLWVVWESSRTNNWDIFYTISNEIPSVHDVAVTDITALRSTGSVTGSVSIGETLYFNVTVENQGDFNENFNVTVFADMLSGNEHIEIGTQNLSLTNGTTTILTFVWETMNVTPGSYFVSAEATVVPGEWDTEDNILIGGAYIGGIFPPWKQPQVNLLAKFSPLFLTILIMVALGLGAIAFFKLLMSIKPRWPWRQITRLHQKSEVGY